MIRWSKLGRIVLVLATGFLAGAPSVLAEELVLSSREVANLGITLVSPEAADATDVVQVRGRVVIPPAGDIALSPSYQGLVVRLLHATGDRVAVGDVLAEISAPAFLDVQRGFLDAWTAHELHQQRLARDRQLVAEGIVSRRRLEETRAGAAGAAAALTEHRQMLRLAGLDDAAIDGLAARRELLPLLPVRAPLDGVVLECAGRVGSGVSPTEALFRLGDLSTLWLEMQVPQQRLDAIGAGMAVMVESSTEPVGRVAVIGGAVDPATQMVMVRAELDVTSHGLRPGQFVAARIVGRPAAGHPAAETAPADGAAAVWSVPAGSVIQAGDGHFVFLRTASGFRAAPVRRLGGDGAQALVAAGFDADARIANAGVSALKSLWDGPAAVGS